MYNVLIRPLVVEDANTSWKWRNDREVWAQTGNSWDKPITLNIEIEWIKKVITDETTKRFAITVDDQYVGNVQLTDITDSEAQFHIFIGEKSFWGQGIANQATYQILNYAKEILNLTEVYLYVKKSNVFAIKVYKKNSFIIDEEDGGKIKMTCKLTDLKAPMVSIFCMVYNHEKYISDSIESFLMQKNNFNTIIVIGEDCSTDRSRDVINSYVQRFPGKFRLIYHNVNVGANKNQEIVLKNCEGKYIAFCEGDDYWTDSLKLQKQVDFLEQHPQYIFAAHGYHTVNSKNEVTLKNTEEPEQLYPNGHVIDKTNVFDIRLTKTLTLLFKRDTITEEFYNYTQLTDTVLKFHVINKGNGYWLADNMGAYRLHENNVFGTLNLNKKLKFSYDTWKSILQAKQGDRKLAKTMFSNNLTFMLQYLIHPNNRSPFQWDKIIKLSVLKMRYSTNKRESFEFLKEHVYPVLLLKFKMKLKEILHV